MAGGPQGATSSATLILLVEVSTRATAAAQVKLHPWFKGLDWASLARTKSAFTPAPDHEYDTSYFMPKPVHPLAYPPAFTVLPFPASLTQYRESEL